MAINKKLIHFTEKQNFSNEVAKGNILDTSIIFIKDTKQIWTHDQIYDCSSNIEATEVEYDSIDDILPGGSSDSFLTKTEAISLYQPILISNTNIKTINGQSLLGSGDITITGSDGSGISYTAGTGITITNNTISIDTSIIARKSDIPTNYLTSSDLNNYATKAYVSSAIANAQLGGSSSNIDLSGYQSKITGTNNRVIILNNNGEVVTSDITSEQLSSLSGVTSNIQDQIDSIPTYTAGSGIVINNDIIRHTNTISAVSTEGFFKFKYDAQGHITGKANVTKEDITTLGIPDTIYEIATTNSNGLMSSADKTKLNDLTIPIYTYISKTSSYTYLIPTLSINQQHHTIIKNDGSDQITIAIPTSGCICTTDSLSIDAGKYGEINALNINGIIYIRTAN